MKIFIFLLLMFSCSICVSAQEKNITVQKQIEQKTDLKNIEKTEITVKSQEEKISEEKSKEISTEAVTKADVEKETIENCSGNSLELKKENDADAKTTSDFLKTEKGENFKLFPNSKLKDENIFSDDKTFSDDDKSDVNDSSATHAEKFHWKPALIQSGIFLAIQHSLRMTQEKTTRELDGPFFRDWWRSVKSLHGWEDGNKFFTNYIAHPLQGSVTGRIFVNNSDRSRNLEFGKSKKYWESRMKAMLWSAVWSTQFELGPISEATLGNVGINGDSKYNKMSWVDLVVTPVGGTLFMVAEDAIDKHFFKNWLEKKSQNKIMIKVLRTLFLPTSSVANVLRWRYPWHNDNRPLRNSNLPMGN